MLSKIEPPADFSPRDHLRLGIGSQTTEER
jgi:hypothetical protein